MNKRTTPYDILDEREDKKICMQLENILLKVLVQKLQGNYK
ncbi:hypothetical protein [Bacillus mobilis]